LTIASATCLESHVKLKVQLLKNMSQDFVDFFSIPLHLMFLNAKSTRCDWRFVLNYAVYDAVLFRIVCAIYRIIFDL